MIAVENQYLPGSAYGFNDHPQDMETEACGLEYKVKESNIKYL